MVERHTSAAVAGATAPSLLQDDVTRVRVLLPLPLTGAYDYRVPEELALVRGASVRVRLGKRSEIGVLWDGAPAQEVADARLKNVIARLDAPPLPEESRRFIDWVAAYTLAAPGARAR